LPEDISLGCCPKNLVDGEVMLGIAREAGHEITPRPATPTSSSSTPAPSSTTRSRSRSTPSSRWRAEAGRPVFAARRDRVPGRALPRRAAEGDPRDRRRARHGRGAPDSRGVGSGRRARPAATPLKLFRGRPADAGAESPGLRTRDRGFTPRRNEAPLPTYLYDADTPRLLTTPRHFAYVKIAEGCDYTCAFCIIPTLRGAYRSRTADSIVREARALAARGVRELLLISQDTTFYGIDRGERGALARLLRELNAIEGLAWIRLLYLYPTTITDDVLVGDGGVREGLPLRRPAAPARLAGRARAHAPAGQPHHLHAPARPDPRRVPGVTLRTTLIVGFPGETEADFAELEGFVSDIGFDHVGVFTYSHEEGTRAFGLPDDVPSAVKQRRRRALMSRQKRIVARAQRARIGSCVDILIDGPSPESELVLQGRLEGQAPDIDPVVFLTEADLERYGAGDLVGATVVGARGYDLVVKPSR
jgi:ribosomal protein S12 methylthiotransferase